MLGALTRPARRAYDRRHRGENLDSIAPAADSSRLCSVARCGLGGVFVVFAGGGASSTLHQYQYEYQCQYGPQVTVGLVTTIGTICPEFQSGRADELDEIPTAPARGG